MERARVVLVTNVGQGFGRAVALAYGRAGYHVVCADRDVDLASKTAAEVEELGGQAIPIQADMTTQMDVLTTYQKVLEIFGALGGVVHLASQVSTSAFESLTEGEFFEVMAEDVRSTFLVLKTAARLLSVGWVVVVAPPSLGAVQMMTVNGALEQMIKGFRERFSYPRVNLVMPSRLSADPRHDQALVRTVRYLGSHDSVGVSGQLFDVDLPEPPQVTESLLPEVRAALDTNVRQEEEYGYLWGAAQPVSDDGSEDDDDDAPDFDGVEDEAVMAASEYGFARYPERAISSLADDDGEGEDDDEAGSADDDDAFNEGEAEGDADLAAPDRHDDDYDDYAAFDLHWSRELGLRAGPALRHVIGDDLDGVRVEESYAAGLEPAVDLYGDLTRLEGSDAGEFPSDYEGETDEYQQPITLGPYSNPDGIKKRR